MPSPTDRGLKTCDAAAGGVDDGLRTEHVKRAIPDAEADRTGDPVGTRLVHQQMRHHDSVEHFSRLAGGLGDDRFVALAVDHDLPFAFSQIAAGLRVLHDRQTPFLEHMDRGIDMAGDVEDQVLAHQAHQVASRVAHEVFRLVLAPLHAHIAVDCRQAVSDGAAPFDVRLFDNDNLQVASPVSGFVSGAAAAEAAAYDEDVRLHKLDISGRS